MVSLRWTFGAKRACVVITDAGLHPKFVRRRPAAVSPRGRANSKQARVLALLCRPSGATITTVTRSPGWQPHTVRAFLAAVVRKKLGLRLTQKTDGERVYRIVAGKASGDATGVPSA